MAIRYVGTSEPVPIPALDPPASFSNDIKDNFERRISINDLYAAAEQFKANCLNQWVQVYHYTSPFDRKIYSCDGPAEFFEAARRDFVWHTGCWA